MRCPSCTADLPDRSRFCNSCGAALTEADTRTVASRAARQSSSNASEDGRFPSGTILGERYRILGLIGRGGMGEVYRVFDLKLDQTVALKFLPAATAGNSRLLERFRGEVRIARQVSHRNVCRVHDIGEAEGAAFLSMEYVDGEDLKSLLGKIGRLPSDKALEIARKLCAGLGAAHEKGVLHRDLKPANIMLDSRGQVLIMDFGLAAAADAIPGTDVRSGTPAYMAPEQKEGREVTARSDIYSLGLVLREMFTGQRVPLDGKLTTTVKDLDPAVESVIQRCLDLNPRNRPASALDIARALPGGDPLAEALAAGDTPSPAMVAASDDTAVVSVRATVACLVWILLGLAPALLLTTRASVLRGIPLPDSPEILARAARDLVARLGYTEPPADSAYGFRARGDFNLYARDNLKPEDYRAMVTRGQPSAIVFWYRQSPSPLVAPNGTVSPTDPPHMQPNMVRVDLDPEGRLSYFDAVPPEDLSSSPSQAADWEPLFEAARLDPARWTSATPQRRPPSSFDAQAAWTGSYAHAPDLPMRIEAAAWRGRPVHFEITGPWTTQAGTPQGVSRRLLISQALVGIVSVIVVLSTLLLAWRNHRHGRSDTRGAVRLALFASALGLGEWLLARHYMFVPALLFRFYDSVGSALFSGFSLLVLYTALEPYLRRRWPQSLISWTRLLEGRWRDPVVAGHVLMGTALGMGFRLLIASGSPQGRDIEAGPVTATLLGPLRAVGEWAAAVQEGLWIALGFLLAVFLLRAIFRRTWLAVAVLLSLVVITTDAPLGGALAVCVVAGALTTLFRFGVLPLVVAYSVSNILALSTFGSDFSAWYAPTTFLAVGLVLALAAWSFKGALGGRQVWTGEFLDR